MVTQSWIESIPIYILTHRWSVNNECRHADFEEKRELRHSYGLLNSWTCDMRLILETHGDPFLCISLFKRQKFPTYGKITQEWDSQITHFFQAWRIHSWIRARASSSPTTSLEHHWTQLILHCRAKCYIILNSCYSVVETRNIIFSYLGNKTHKQFASPKLPW